MSQRQQTLIENFRKLLQDCGKPDTKMSIDVLRDMETLLSGLANFPNNHRNVKANLNTKINEFHNNMMKKAKEKK